MGGTWRRHYRATSVETVEAAESAAAANAASQLGAYPTDDIAVGSSSSAASAFPARRHPSRNVGVTNASVANNNNSFGSFADINVDDGSDDSSTSSYDSLLQQHPTQQIGTRSAGVHALAGSVSTWRSVPCPNDDEPVDSYPYQTNRQPVH